MTLSKSFKCLWFLIAITCTMFIFSCGIYNFTGGSVGSAKTFQVNFFRNEAPIVEPGLDRDFTLALQDLITNQTNLLMSDSQADLIYEGEIVDFQISPMTATAAQTAAQNRLTMVVSVRFTNTVEEDKDFDKKFSFYYDYPASSSFESVKNEALQALFERITQDIFNASLADW